MPQNQVPKEWRLSSRSPSMWLPMVLPLVMVMLGLVALVCAALGIYRIGDFNFYFLVVWVGVGVWVSYQSLRMPRFIAIEADNWICFRSPLGETRMRARDVLAIRPSRGQLGLMQLEYQGGSLQFFAQFDGFHTFLTQLGELNPAIVMQGC
jgi:hypothetical protein